MKLKTSKNSSTRVVLDAEWQKKHLGKLTQTITACLQVMVDGQPHILINCDYYTTGIEKSASKYFIPHKFDFRSNVSPLDWLLDKLEIVGDVDLIMFYSPKDLRVAFTDKIACDLFKDKKIKDLNGLMGRFNRERRRVRVMDVWGMFRANLSDTIEALGLSDAILDAKRIELDKTKMLDEMVNRTEEFMKYAHADIASLELCIEKIIEGHNNTMDAVGINPEYHYDISNLPQTSGGQVSGIIERYIWDFVKDKYKPVYHYCIAKLGRLKDAKGLSKHKAQLLKETLNARKQLDIRLSMCDNLDEALEEILKFPQAYDFSMYEFLAYSEAGVLAQGRQIDSDAKYNAIVLGGRCNRENQSQNVWEYVVDADLKSAYASKLRRIRYPVGLPKVLHYTTNDTHMTFGEFRKKLMGKCEQYLVFVTGKLGKFRQDLFYSKQIKPNDIVKAVLDEDFDGDIESLKGDTILLKDQLLNAPITTESWEKGSLSMSKDELSAFDKLTVVTAMYYLKADKMSVEDWMWEVIKDKGSFTGKSNSKDNNQAIVDTRTRKYFEIPFEGLFGVTTDKRNEVKAKSKLHKGTDLGRKLLAEQTFLKLFNNTGYGVLASVYKPVCNTLIGNRITSEVRTAAWMMAKATNGFQTITDGLAYQPNNVFKLNTSKSDKRKPSLTVLAKQQTLKEHRNISCGKMCGIDWEIEINKFATTYLTSNNVDKIKVMSEFALKLDTALTSHIKEFWSNYGIDFNLEIEHKIENTAFKWACIGKADYAFDSIFGERKYKVRGSKHYPTNPKYFDRELKHNPKFDDLDNLLDGKDDFDKNRTYESVSLLSPGEFCHIQKCPNWSRKEEKNLMPGDELVRERKLRYNNIYADLDVKGEDNLEAFNRRKRRYNEKMKVEGVSVLKPIFEQHGDEGLNSVLDRMHKDRLKKHE
ncbi:MAG: hypothetical protein F6K22_27940 [Okeania sp. SIO2F4]|uniref:hypothetical protein n=1 Tax=Okeania sp. SIO2F4 TaxID=2607790 RepID=UPI00142BF20B|nr:hypothetical protein [Okeania sp. SIO2F4]NES06309.1 hypothetical protein [Okeania sp. SIO2F4]